MTKPTSSILQVDTLILGGGLTGLSTAYHLEKRKHTDYLVIEKNATLGGWCTSETHQGFTFDCSGHLLHLHHPYTLRFVRTLLPHHLIRHQRKAFICIAGKRIPFPFQANLWALPAALRQSCVQGLAKTAPKKQAAPKTFEQWCLSQFGTGIYQHFFKPYNEKLWQTPLSHLTCDWCGPFVPAPTYQQITASIKQASTKKWGYNSHFYYPKRGGCGALAQALADHVPNVWLNAHVQQINWTKKQVLVNGKKIHYNKLVNTLPLPQVIALCKQVSPTIQQAAASLHATTVHVLNVAINRKLPPFHWIYFPEKDVPFYRVGMQSAFSPHNAPPKTTSLYIETADSITDFAQTKKAIFKALVQKGIIRASDKILFSYWRTLYPAYAIYDTQRANMTPKLLAWLQRKHIYSAGRYGLWEYSFMERNILQGKELADTLLKL